MSPKAKELLRAITKIVKESGLEPREAIDVMLACAAGLAVKFATHTCPEFFDLAHDLFHNAEDVRQHSVNKEPTRVH